MNQKFFPWKPLILSGAFLTALTACSSGEGTLDLLPETDAVEIRLSGDIGSLTGSADTRKPIDANYTSLLNVYFARVDQDVNTGNYPAYATVAPLSATRVGGAGQTAINFSTPQYYLTRETNNNTKLVGWYPTIRSASGVVTFNISEGTQDVMLTQELVGNKNSQFGSGKSFEFKHLLTRVIVKAYGDATVSNTWGKVNSVKVKGQPTKCVVALPGTAANAISWDGTTDIALRNSATDGSLTAGISLSTSIAGCGYAMFQPTAGDKLTLIVNTEKGGEREVEVSAPTGSSTFEAGKAYTITLQFKSTAIAPTASIAAWTSGGNVNADL